MGTYRHKLIWRHYLTQKEEARYNELEKEAFALSDRRKEIDAETRYFSALAALRESRNEVKRQKYIGEK